MGSEVDSIAIRLGLDPTLFKAGLAQVLQALTRMEAGARSFGAEMENASRRASSGVTAFGKLSNLLVGKLKKLAKFAAPALGAFSVGALVKSYASDIAEVAERTGYYSTRLEEARKKKALMNRVTREDLELYKKTRLAMSSFQIAMSSLGNALMRALMPAFSFMAKMLDKLATWVRNNQGTIVRFVKVVATMITAMLLPALMKMGAALLANPITWIVAALIALALIIDDFITYLEGGESVIGDILKAFGAAWQWIKDVALAAFNTLIAGIKRFFSYFTGAFNGLKQFLRSFVNIFVALFHGDFGKAWESVKSMIAGWLTFVFGIFGGIFNYWKDSMTALLGFLAGIGSSILSALQGAWQSVTEFFSSLSLVEKGKELMQSFIDGIMSMVGAVADKIKGVVDGIKGFFGFGKGGNKSTLNPFQSGSGNAANPFGTGGGGDAASPFGGGSGQAVDPFKMNLGGVASPVFKGGASNTTTMSASIGTITVNTQATDAAGISRDIGAAMQDNAFGGLVAAAQTGTVQK